MLGCEIDLLANYPRTKRDVEARGRQKTEADRKVAREFGREFFDGSRDHGYGGFVYHPKYWQPVIPVFQQRYQLNAESCVLDVGCAKGFMLYDMMQLIQGISVSGIDVSAYAIENAIDNVKPYCQVACATQLPFADKSQDLVVSITTLHNLEQDELVVALKEIERVKRKHSFITVDAYHNDAERERMIAWNLTAKTVMHVDEWKMFFKKAGYTGDYFWFIP